MNTAVLFAVWLSSAEPAVAGGITMYQDSASDDLGNPVELPPPPPDGADEKGIRLGITLMVAGSLFTLWTWAAKRDDG